MKAVLISGLFGLGIGIAIAFLTETDWKTGVAIIVLSTIASIAECNITLRLMRKR